MNQIVIAPEVLERFHELATTTHRTDADLIDEALNSYLAADRHYLNVLLVRISAADRGDFSPSTSEARPLAERSTEDSSRNQPVRYRMPRRCDGSVWLFQETNSLR